MMIFTHILVGAFLGVGIGTLYPELFPFAVYAGFLGGGFPDLDMVFTHRRTLHFPVLYSIAGVVAGGIAVLWTTPITVSVSCFLLAGALHSLTDILGGGKEMRPWRETDNRAVFNHVTQSWLRPWRVFYDGSVADLILSVILAIGLFVLLPASYYEIVTITLSGAVVYTVLRRWITRKISEDYQTFSEYIQDRLATLLNKM
jgi:hypothetical protein